MALDEYIQPALTGLSKQKESIIGAALTAALPGWTLIDVKKRCRWERITNTTYETLLLDGVPILELHDLEFPEPVIEGEKYVIRVNQQYRFLGRAASPQESAHGD